MSTQALVSVGIKRHRFLCSEVQTSTHIKKLNNDIKFTLIIHKLSLTVEEADDLVYKNPYYCWLSVRSPHWAPLVDLECNKIEE